MARTSQDMYNPTQTVEPTTAAPNDYDTTRATPDVFGAQKGQAIYSLSRSEAEGEQELFKTGLQYLGTLNEMAATDGEAKLAEIHGQLKSEYQSKEGLDAVAAHNDYVQKVQAAQQQIAQTMPNLAARRSFDMLTARSTAYTIRDMGDYAATQFKAAQKNSNAAGLSLAKNQLGDPFVANDPIRSKDAFDSIKYYTQQGLKLSGFWPEGTSIGTDGNPVFPNTPDGQKADNIYKSTLEDNLGEAQVIKYKTLLDDPQIGADTAWDTFQKERDNINPKAQSQILSMIRPRVIDSQTRQIADKALSQIHQDYINGFDTSSHGAVDKNSLYSAFSQQESGGGINTKTSATGAKGEFQIEPSTFAHFAHPGENINNPKDSATVAKRYIDYLSKLPNVQGDPARVAVGYFSGEGNIAPPGSPHPWKKDKVDPSGKTTSSYVSDILHRIKGVGLVNENGGYMSEADYIRTHINDYLDNIKEEAQAAGLEPTAVDLAVSRGYSNAQHLITQQEMSDRADQDLVERALNGEFNNGQPLSFEYQLQYGPNNVRQAWQNLQMRDPLTAMAIQTRYLPNNARNLSKDYGDNFFDLYSQIEEGKIHDTKDLIKQIGPGLSQNGFNVLKTELTNRNTPEGKAFASAQFDFFKRLHNDATGQSLYPGIQSPVLEKSFVKQIPTILNAINFAKSNNIPVKEMFDPTNPHYVGKAFIMPKFSQIISELERGLVTAGSRTISSNTIKPSIEEATKMWHQGMFKNKQELRDYLINNKLVNEAPEVPKPQ